MVNASDGGGGGGDGFPRNPTYFDEGVVHGDGGGSVGSGPDAPGVASTVLKDVALSPLVNVAAGLIGEGVYDKVSAAVRNVKPEDLDAQAEAWGQVMQATNRHQTDLGNAITKLAGAWEGEDADKALPIMRGLHATLYSQHQNANLMNYAVRDIGVQMKYMKDNFADGQNVGETAVNAFTGSDDRAAADAYKNLVTNLKSNVDAVPEKVPSEIKDNGGSTQPNVGGLQPGAKPQGPPASSGGAGASPHVGNPGNPTIGPPPELPPTPVSPPPPETPPVPEQDLPGYDGPGDGDYPGGSGGAGSSPYPGGGAGISSPGVDTSGSLAGYGGGAGAGGGGLPGGGAGAGSLPGGGAGAGGGVGGGVPGGGLGAGAGGGGLGGGAGGGVVGTGAGGRAGMMPMHGGQGNDEDERERTTWLNEDDDIWGAEENLPGVIH